MIFMLFCAVDVFKRKMTLCKKGWSSENDQFKDNL